ncbi:menaquinol-cytochrome c reductase cytochrome b/c subunit [Cohnella thailandensis]|uniref:C-type cytochrome n=1 Tax=Cohnella thailandensis TaxID=557557 RepID=A0A841SSP1_9BACL|nr:menaquinol-cytochrome c reductase cytochrome b/c subunit [Cohnella thailandensis]MBB6635363.1 c-type cytochrome [Cohnella thailandensis]MBP1974742.1 menaquinol-cytochrome c reductase cytochrome b/c subunit [Cohnella thailandensis]
MAHGHKSDEKIVYVGDSRIRQRSADKPTPPDYTSFPGKSEAFIPNFLLKEWMAGVVILVGFLVLTIAEPAPLGYPADPLNGSFIPMPDWYFLFIYQLLKYPYASEDYIILGTIGIPGLAFGALLLAPFLDTGKERRFYRRPIASSMMIVSLVASIYLTWVSWHHYTEELEKNGVIPEHIEREIKSEESIKAGKGRYIAGKEDVVALVKADDPAFSIMQQAQCIACHGAELEGANGPSLRGIGDALSKEQLVDTITNGKNEGMPAFKGQLTEAEIDQIATWLSEQKAAAAE